MKKTDFMRCTADLHRMSLRIPGVALKISGFEGQTQAEYRPLDNVIVVLKKRMTAPELLTAVEQLNGVATELLLHLDKVCGPCEECVDGCLCGESEDSPLQHLPTDLLLTFAEAGTCLGELEEHLIMEDIVYGG